jgi:hemolysin D
MRVAKLRAWLDERRARYGTYVAPPIARVRRVALRAWKRWPTPLTQPNIEREFLPAALEIIESPASPTGRITAYTIMGAMTLAFLWALIGKVDVTATAPGRVVPVGNSKVIQPMDIGVVSAIHVADGDHVRKDQVLIELDRTQALADKERFKRDFRLAELDLAQFKGLWLARKQGSTPALVDPPADASASEVDAARAAMLARMSAQAANLSDLDQQIAEKAAEVTATGNSIGRLQASLPFVAKQADLREQLMKLEFGNKLSYLQAQQTLVEQQHQIVVLKDERAQAQAEHASLEQKRLQADADYEKTLLDSLDKAQAQANEMQSELIKASDRLAFKTLRAPIDGTVQELSIHTIGGVVTPAQPLLIVVPNQGGLTVEAMVSNRDVGFVHTGQAAKVKVEAFNFTKYGLIDGMVSSISRDTVSQRPADVAKALANSQANENGETPVEPSYVAHIKLARAWMDTETGRLPLGPGMAVNVEIQTGKRRIIDYLLSPLRRQVGESLHER